MSQLSFRFVVPKDSSYHQARVIVDGKDILEDSDYIGMDPVEFFEQKALRSSGWLLVGRCNCGIASCGSFEVLVNRTNDAVEWAMNDQPEAEKYVFNLVEYDRCVEKYAADISWETTDRTAERLIAEKDFSQAEVLGLTFKAINCHETFLSLTFTRQALETHVAFNIPWNWDVGTSNEAVIAVQEMLDKWEAEGCAPSPEWQWVQ
jgi:hypothetical protein